MTARTTLIVVCTALFALALGAVVILPSASASPPVASAPEVGVANLAEVRGAAQDPSLPDVVATVNGQAITKIELAQAEEILGNGHVPNLRDRTTEEAALNVLIDTTVADQSAANQGLDPSASEARSALADLLAAGHPLYNLLRSGGIDPATYVNALTVHLYQLAAGRNALFAKVTSGVEGAQKGAVWASYVNSLVDNATITKYGGL